MNTNMLSIEREYSMTYAVKNSSILSRPSIQPVSAPKRAAISTQKEQRIRASLRDISCALPEESRMSRKKRIDAVTTKTVHMISIFVMEELYLKSREGRFFRLQTQEV